MTFADAPLAANGCQSLCSWSPPGEVRSGEQLFRCAGCGSEWVASQPWTPAEADGSVAPEIAAEIARVRRS